MTTERDLEPYLSTLAASIDPPTGDLASVRGRAEQRRRARRGGVTAIVAVALLGGALGVATMNQSEPTATVAGQADAVALVDSTFDWSIVTPTSGVGWATSATQGADNALYALSTAPGSIEYTPGPATLYRSIDGVEWASVPLPADFSTSAIAPGGSSIYAVGTAPAGGSAMSLRLAQLDPSDEVTTTDLPIDLAAMQARLGSPIGIGQLQVATSGSNVLVAARLFDQDGVQRFLDEAGIDARGGYSVTADGVVVYAPFDDAVEPNGAKPGAADPDAAIDIERARALEAGQPEVIGRYTFEDLGIDHETRELILGTDRLFLSEQGGEFTEVAPPPVAASWNQLVGSLTGFSYVSTSQWPAVEQTTVWTSTDGHEWIADAFGARPGYPTVVSTYRGQAAIVMSTYGLSQGATVLVQQSTGAWAELDVIEAVRNSGVTGDLSVGPASAGPLGVAVTVLSIDDDSGEVGEAYLVLTNGTTASVTDLSEEGFATWPQSVTVTADAVIVTGASTGKDPAEPLPLRALVGTPTR